MNRKGYKDIILLGIIVALLGIIAYLAFVRKATAPTVSEPSPTQDTDTGTDDGTGNASEKTYSNGSFEFIYPSVLTVAEQSGVVSITHGVPYPHVDVCDFKGDAPDLDQLTDFEVSLQISESGLKDTVRTHESDYVMSSYFQGATLETSSGFIEEYSVGSLQGYRITSTLEGCGQYTYYFPLAPDRTLFVSRAAIAEFNPIVADYQTYLDVPGVISPSEEESYFQRIISSFQAQP